MAQEIIHGDCLNEMRMFCDNHFSGIVTDPPYGLQFMGKQWDQQVPGKEYWKEMLRICKPGSFLLAFGGTRTYHRLACAIEDAGWEIRDCLQWIYGSGFPKSLDVGKTIDKSKYTIDQFNKFGVWFDEQCRKDGITEKIINEITNRKCSNQFFCKSLQKEIPTQENWENIKHLLSDIPDWVNKLIKPAYEVHENFKKREIISSSLNGIAGGKKDGWGFEKEFDITKPFSILSQAFSGYGTALKPAYEPIIMAMKPIDGTFAQNAEKWGQAGINIDGCRVATDDNRDRLGCGKKGEDGCYGNSKTYDSISHQKGRWPANVILDEESGKMLDEMSGNLKSGSGDKHNKTQKGGYHGNFGLMSGVEYKADSGGASRFFFIAPKDKSDIIYACELQEELSLYGKKTENENNNQNTDLYGNEPMGLFLPDTISIIEMGTLSIMIFPIFNASKPELIGTCTLESEKNINKSMILNIESVNIAENGECLIRFLNDQMEPIKAIAKNVPSNAWLNGEMKIENTGTSITEKDERIPVTNTIKNTVKSIERKSTQKDVSDTQNLRNRFFYCAKASSSERNAGLEGMPLKNKGIDNGQKRDNTLKGPGNSRNPDKNTKMQNFHPTVKPLKLMEYLLKLIAPPKDAIILDPFCGSGTTLLAAKNLGISAMGIEKEAAYCDIIRGRLNVKQLDFMEAIA